MTCFVIVDRNGYIQGVGGDDGQCYPSQGAALDVVKTAGPLAIIGLLVVEDPECPNHKAAS